MRQYPSRIAGWTMSLLLALALLAGCAAQESSSAPDGSVALAADTSPVSETSAPSTPTAVPTAATPATTTATAAPTAQPTLTGPSDVEADSSEGIVDSEGGGGGKNIVQVRNQQNGRFVLRGRIQLNHIPGPNVEPVNLAFSYGECTDCQTFAIALQINLISRSAVKVAPQNAAVAVNIQCLRCYTVSRAVQYTYSVDDPTKTPDEIGALLRELEAELRRIDNADITLEEAESRVEAVLARFRELAPQVQDVRDETREEQSATTPTPFGTPATSPTATPATPSATPTSTAQPVTPSATPTSTAPPVTPSATPQAPSPEPSPSPATTSPSPTPTETTAPTP